MSATAIVTSVMNKKKITHKVSRGLRDLLFEEDYEIGKSLQKGIIDFCVNLEVFAALASSYFLLKLLSPYFYVLIVHGRIAFTYKVKC